MSDQYQFPFGRAVLPCRPSAGSPRPVFILGAYPSALHVRWQPPADLRPIQAIAVDNEPTPFWSGEDAASRVEEWKRAVGFDATRWGKVSAAGKLNGSSGRWVGENVLRPLAIQRDGAWITDCLDTYRCSDDLWTRLGDTYAPFAERGGLPSVRLPKHPSEAEIVSAALEHHRGRLLAELDAGRPELVVTLGNAALRVLRELVAADGADLPAKLSSKADAYGLSVPVSFAGRRIEWLPLAHPAAPEPYQVAHQGWVQARQTMASAS